MSTRSLVDLGHTIVGWWMIVIAPVTVIIRTLPLDVFLSASSQFTLGVFVALPLAVLHWWFGKSLGRLGDYIVSLVVIGLLIGVVVVAVVTTFQLELTTETVPGTLVTGGVLCVVYISAYYWTYDDGGGWLAKR